MERVTVNFQAGKARVGGEAGKLQVAEIVSAVRLAGGYQPALLDPVASPQAVAKEEEMESKGDRTSVWSALAAVGIGIAGSWC